MVHTSQNSLYNSNMQVVLYDIGPQSDLSMQHAYGRLTLTAALGSTRAESVAFSLECLPSNGLKCAKNEKNLFTF